MKNYISLHGSYYPNNFGDVLILAIQANWIKEISKGEVVLPYATKVYRDTIKPSSLRGKDGIKKSEKLVYGAGGYLGETPKNKWMWGFKFFKKHVLPAELAIKNNIEYALIGPGVGPLTNILTRKEVVRICKNSSVITVRDEESKEFLVKYGVSEKKINVTVDVALSISNKDIPIDSINRIDKIFSNVKGKKYGFHMGVDVDSPIYGDQVKILFEESIRFVNENPKIMPVLIIDNDNPQQNKAVEYMKNKINKDCIIYKHEYIWDTTALLGKLDMVLTNKLHVGIVSYALNTNCIALPYHPKTIRFYKQINREDLCIPLTDLKINNIYNLLIKSTKEAVVEEWNRDREVYLPQLRKKALLNKKILRDFLL